MTSQQLDRQEITKLLSQIMGQEIHEKYISHRLLFMTALVTLLMGVMYADDQVTEAEKEHITSVIRELIPPKSYLSKLIRPILIGVKQNKSYKNNEIISQLADNFTEPEKILLIKLSYEVAAIDGEVAEKEGRYIQQISQALKIDSRYLPYLLGDVEDQVPDQDTLSGIYRLLDPHHFQDLDPALMRAADLLRAKLPNKVQAQEPKVGQGLSLKKLGEFQQLRNQLVAIAEELNQLIEQGVEQEVLSDELQASAAQVVEKTKSQRFRIAVVGEFSQGKSTLLNALLGEEIQPVRAIPCSGTVTVLKHGERRRVVCRYNDRREVEVPIGQYQELASISQEAALSNIAEELSQSAIQEIVFEHPDLELCRHHVEIVDSPGLNEHPARSVITHQLLKDTDAAIFLANASRPFTQGEMELLRMLRQQLRGGDTHQPAENLFVLVNFMDLLRREQDREHVKLRAHNFLQGESPIIAGQNRLHFISAQAALDAMLEGSENEYLQSFQDFVQAIQIFLTEERGALVLRQSKEQLAQIIRKTQLEMQETTKLLDGQIALSESDQRQILEQMGVASGRQTNLRLLCKQSIEEILVMIDEAWAEWLDGIGDRIARKSNNWQSDSDEKEKILQDYATQFQVDLSADLDTWFDSVVKQKILVPKIRELEQEIAENLKAIYQDLKEIDSNSGSNLSDQFDLSLSQFGVDIQFGSDLDLNVEDEDGVFGFLAGASGVGFLGGSLAAALGVGFLPILLGGFAIGGVLGWLFGDDPEEIELEMKREVYTKGFEKFEDSLDQIDEHITDSVVRVIKARDTKAAQAIQNAIAILDGILKKQKVFYQEISVSHKVKQEFISSTTTDLNRIQSNLQVLLPD